MIRVHSIERCCKLFARSCRSDKISLQVHVFVRHRGSGGVYDPDKKNFIDFRRVTFEAGKGGDGCVSLFRAANRPKLGPDGGDGGVGGSVILKTDHNIRCLKEMRPQYKAQQGRGGEGARSSGRGGEDITIFLPVGTVVRDAETKEVLCDLLYDDQEHYIARGGHGGVGNMAFKNSVYQAPRESIAGGEGQKVRAELEMKCLADVGLVGFPNAGKSSFLRAISKARPKVASYPFTTLHPHIGMMEFNDEDHVSIPVADIPGLIEGAHENKGLGHSFLKHIERCSSLLFVIDISMGADYARSQYDKLTFELEQYKEGLSKQPSAVIASKVDIAQDVKASLATLRAHTGLSVEACSSVTHQNIDEVKLFLRRFQRKVQRVPRPEKPEHGTILNMDGQPSIMNSLRNFTGDRTTTR